MTVINNKLNLSNEKGYALITVLFMTTVLTILMLSLMAAMLQSSKFVNISTNNVQTKLAAERAVDEATGHIEATVQSLNTSISNNSLGTANLPSTLSSDLSSIQNSSGSRYTIQETVLKNELSTSGIYLDELTITAPIQNSSKKYVRTMTISTIADVFRYSVVTDGSLTLNGASYLTGNIYVANNLYLSKQGKYLYQQLYSNGSVASTTYYYPTSSYPAATGNITVKNKIYNNTYPSSASCSGTCTTNPVQVQLSPSNVSSYFYPQYVPHFLNDQVQSNQVDISGQITAVTNYWNPIVSARNPSNSTVYSTNYQPSNGQTTINGNLIVKGNLTVPSKATLNVTGNIYVEDNAALSGNITCSGSNGIYVGGTLSVNGLELAGKLYVNGVTTIQNNFDSNGSVYSNGNITVSNLSTNISNDTLLLLSNGSILLKNNNQFSTWNNKQVLNAFFYSKSDIEIYGIGSNLQINGGVYGAKSITLDAVKGNTTSNGNGLVGSIQRYQDSLPPSESRLIINFNPNIMLNPPTGIPTLKSMTLKEIDTRYVNG
jgi:Tfp pilus assembly protein PilX